MSVKTSAILVDGTVATTGGTSTSFIDKGGSLEVQKLILDDSSEFAAQTSLTFSIKEPKISSSAPNGFTQARNTVKVMKPLALDNGSATVNTVTLQLSVDPETTDAEVENLLVTAAQLLHDSDYSAFWKKQSLG